MGTGDHYSQTYVAIQREGTSEGGRGANAAFAGTVLKGGFSDCITEAGLFGRCYASTNHKKITRGKRGTFQGRRFGYTIYQDSTGGDQWKRD